MRVWPQELPNPGIPPPTDWMGESELSLLHCVPLLPQVDVTEGLLVVELRGRLLPFQLLGSDSSPC